MLPWKACLIDIQTYYFLSTFFFLSFFPIFFFLGGGVGDFSFLNRDKLLLGLQKGDFFHGLLI